MATRVTESRLEGVPEMGRLESGADRYDEVWDGIEIMSPLADDEHQQVASGLGAVFYILIAWPGLGGARTGVNVSDRVDGWRRNYRIPDVAVFLRGTSARNCGTHWRGGPDLAVEVASPDDHARDKLPFYAAIKTRELLLVDRDPWALELYQLRGDPLVLVGRSDMERPSPLASAVLPLTFRLIPGETRPQIEIAHGDGIQRWLI